uniref:Phospholipid-transporting ATPase n=1 Tax=Oryzias sinensis TaxID=183150 RepID=A0A8C7XR01_9TELE
MKPLTYYWNRLRGNKEEKERLLRANDRSFNLSFHYAKNEIKTSKYNIITFLPLNLYVQFTRLANVYFLLLLILQLIPEISSLPWFTTAVPLVIVLSITGVKDANDDIKRHKSDRQVNNRTVEVLVNGKLKEERWKNVQVGDILKLQNNHFVPADLLLLSSSEPLNLVYVETADLDGCEHPNNRLDKFKGTLTVKGQTHGLDNDKVLLRGCTLRNTEWCFGLVIFGGPDTKLMQNSGQSKFKRTRIDHMMNILVLCVSLCSLKCKLHKNLLQANSTTLSSFFIFWSYIIVLNTVVPISLYVSVEIIRLGNSFFIDWDRKMYYPKKDTPAQARTTTLNEELGQIKYIFSDKTGTLTQNIMTFNKCSINGKPYGEQLDSNVKIKLYLYDFSGHKLADPKFIFHDHSLVETVREGNSEAHAFFRLLALCHTVMPEEKKEGELNYQAQSPDESALVTAARNFGFVFHCRTPETITVMEMGRNVVYELVAVLDFSNVRKRMSVIVRSPEGKITLFCKGADIVICERLHPSSDKLMEATMKHLNEYAGDGLRTLVLAYKDLDESYLEGWRKRHHEASIAMEEREERLDDLYEEIEKDMTLLGATAVEDKLQDGVPHTIEQLAEADIKIWVLTGDKQETAENIGYACNILREDMNEVFAFALEEDLELELLRTACMCQTVICCRVTPLQKAQVVKAVKKYKQAVTLSIGDGANDVSMIKTAHIGVGISGQEGMQAVLSSDFSLAQFRYLQRLLLVHGRWSYLRMCKFLRYFFLKNFTFTFVHFWYAFFCGFSAQPVYDDWFSTCYNLVYTALPVLALSLFDQDVNSHWSFYYPKLYTPGQWNMYFNRTSFLLCIMQSCYNSIILFFIPYAALHDTVRQDGREIADYQSFAILLQTCLIIVVNAQIFLDTWYWTGINHFFLWGSMAAYFALTFTMNSNGLFFIFPTMFQFLGTGRNSLNQPNTWLIIFLTCLLCILPIVALRFIFIQTSPTINDKARKHLVRYKMRRDEIPAISLRPPATRRVSTRSSYAFSHSQGYGDLVISQKFLGKKTPRRPLLFGQKDHPLAENQPQLFRSITEEPEEPQSC